MDRRLEFALTFAEACCLDAGVALTCACTDAGAVSERVITGGSTLGLADVASDCACALDECRRQRHVQN